MSENIRNITKEKNVLVFGSSGSGKTRFYTLPNISARIDNGESFVVTDPHGESYRATASAAEKSGYNVRVFNLSNFAASDGWNPFSGLDPDKAELLVRTIMLNTTAKDSDQFFSLSEANLLKALIFYVGLSPNFKGGEHERHMGTVYDLLIKLAAQEGELEELSSLPPEDPSSTLWKMFEASGKLKMTFTLGLAFKLDALRPDMIREVLSHDEIDLAAPVRKKCAYYLITSESNTRYFASLFFAFLFESLMNERPSVPAYIFLDEFASAGYIPNLCKTVSCSRKQGIFTSVIARNIDDLADYNDVSLMANCRVWTILGVTDAKTAWAISEKMGYCSNGEVRRPVMTYEEILMFFAKERKALLITDGEPYKEIPLCGSEAYEDTKDPNDHVPEWEKDEDFTSVKARSFRAD